MKLSQKILKRTAEHVYYEVLMLHFTTMYLGKILNPPTSHRYLVNTILESWGMHLRNLLDFFYISTAQRYKDDVLAEDYVSDLRQFKRQRTKAKVFSHIKKRVAKQFAHLTYHRNVYNRRTKPWQCAKIYNQISPTIVAFYNSLPNNMKRWPHFVELKKVIDATP